MSTSIKRDLELDIALAEMMVKDLNKLWCSYSKKALIAKQERELRQEKKGFLDYASEWELVEGYGYALIDEDTYRKGLAYFEDIKKPPALSSIERHRANILELLNRWKGTVKELNEELHPREKIETESIFDRLARQERAEQYQTHVLNDHLESLTSEE